jgi:radical SAM superfamily enzyme YgiQ (UPF0313 family)
MVDVTLIQTPVLNKALMEPEESEFYTEYWMQFGRMVDQKMPKVGVYDITELPLWIAALGAAAEANDISVKVLDLSEYTGPVIDWVAIERRLEGCDSRIFCMNPFTNSVSVGSKLALLIKRKFGTNAVVMMGGPHVSSVDERTLGDPNIDIVVRGEGDLSFPLVVAAIKADRSLGNIEGVSWKDNGKVVRNPSPTSRVELDAVPFPAYHLIPDTYRNRLTFSRIYTSKGCAFNCAYCADVLWVKRKPKHQSIERSVRQVEAMRTLFGANLVYVGDETFTYNPDHLREFGEEMKHRGFKWIAQTRADRVDPSMLRHMANNNCRLIKYGAESSSQHLLDKIRKGITIEQLKRACAIAKEAGLNVLNYYMLGLPDESRETAFQTIDFIENLLDTQQIDLLEYYMTCPYPGTDLFHNPGRYDIELISDDFDRFREDQPGVLKTRYLSPNELFEIWKVGLRRFAKGIHASRKRSELATRAAHQFQSTGGAPASD